MSNLAQKMREQALAAKDSKAGHCWNNQGFRFQLVAVNLNLAEARPEAIAYFEGPEKQPVKKVILWTLIAHMIPPTRESTDKDAEVLASWVKALGGRFADDYQERTSEANGVQVFLWTEADGKYRRMPWTYLEVPGGEVTKAALGNPENRVPPSSN